MFGLGKKKTQQTQVQPQEKQASAAMINKKAAELTRGMTSVKDLIAPSAIEVDFDNIKVGNLYYRTLFVSGYPRFVSANWLSPLLSFDHALTVSMFIYPTESKIILEDLKRKIAEMEATIESDIERGRVVDPSVQTALDDALALQAQLAKGAERFFQFSLYVTIPANSLDELNRTSREVESTLGSILLTSRHASLQMEEGFKSTLPYCQDMLNIQRNMDTTSLGTTFPFTTASLTSNQGVLYGINEHDGSLVVFDRFSLENANSVVLGKSGVGKSLSKDTPVLVKEANGIIKLEKIGPLVERVIAQKGSEQIEKDIEGTINPGFQVFSFNKNLKAEWSNVSVAARKRISKRSHLYKIQTRSGREFTVTPDHCTVILRSGKIQALRTQDVKVGDVIPLPRKIVGPAEKLINEIHPKQIIPDWPSFLPSSISLDHNFLSFLGIITSEGLTENNQLRIYNTEPTVKKFIVKTAYKIGARPSPIRDTYTKKVDGFRINPMKWFSLLINKLGSNGHSADKRVPSLVFSLSNSQISSYLRGYYEGDGGVEEHSVTCTSKSEELISELSYLLLRFGIIAYIYKKFKRATNAENHKGNYYYELRVSGQENLQKFSENIGFITNIKQQKLNHILDKSPHSNIDIIPGLSTVFKDIYNKLYKGDAVKAPQIFINLKNNKFDPSPKTLEKVISLIEERILEINDLRKQMRLLRELPDLETIITRGSKNRKLNRKLWEGLGQSWRLMKNKEVQPMAINVLKAYKTISGDTIHLPEVLYTTYDSASKLGVSLENFDDSFRATIVDRKYGNTSYNRLRKNADFIIEQHDSLSKTGYHTKNKLDQLRLLAESDLFWDPIVKIERTKNKDLYVYDLTVDNEVFLAGYGGAFVHNSFLIKLEAMRSLMFDTDVFVIDPEGEYRDITTTLGGEYIEFSYNAPIKINPFDLSGVVTEGENELGLKILSLHSLMRVVMGQLSSSEDALLDRALVATYKQKGITPDPQTQTKEPPLMEDLYKAFLGMEDPSAQQLASRLEKFIKGSLAGIFNQQSNLNLKNPFTVFCIKDLESELRPIAMFIILDHIWTKVKRQLKKRILIVDEAWYLMKQPDSATFLYGIAKRARKYYLGLTTITQDVEDFLNTDYGKAIITNSSVQILLKQSPAAIDKIAEVFYLSGGEKHFLLSCDVGEGLFFAGPSHVAMRIVASPEEYELVSSKPSEKMERTSVEMPGGMTIKTEPPATAAVKPAPAPPTTAQPENKSSGFDIEQALKQRSQPSNP
ncbi:hypothetical protein HYT02_01190 [Candidatus Gottesmanbacteria bacterium]|nr:hypothetical protein [Candidatus Gottesmanbacteria bacterium]